MIDELIAALADEFDLIDEEIADVIWLALQMSQSEGVLGIPTQVAQPPTDHGTTIDKPPKKFVEEDQSDPSSRFLPELNSSLIREQAPRAEVYQESGKTEKKLTGSRGLSLRVPDARSLREPLILARSLRPLIRRVSSGTKTVLDEMATTQQVAEQQIWLPVLKPAPEPWLDLALLVDENSSMLVWHRTILELKRLLENYGIFRNVTTWALVTDEIGEVKIRPGIGVPVNNRRAHSPNSILDASGRRLILVVTDCVATYWHTGTVLAALKNWARSGPTAIVQMLPEWLWSRTALILGTPVRFSALTPGVPSQQLLAKPVSAWDEVNLQTGIKIPVITLEPEKFAFWSNLISGKGGNWVPGFVFEPELFALEDGLDEQEDEVDEEISSLFTNTFTAERSVQQFYVSASPVAWQLASLLAAAPVITLPIVRIIQDRLLPQSRQVNVAEVFLSGLLQSSPKQGIHPDYVQYDFVDGVREVLLSSAPLSESINLFDEVSSYIADRFGLSLEAFAAVLRDPKQVEDKELASQIQPIAEVAAQILKQLGEESAHVTEEPEPSLQPDNPLPEAKLIDDKDRQLSEQVVFNFEGYVGDVTAVQLTPNQHLWLGLNEKTSTIDRLSLVDSQTFAEHKHFLFADFIELPEVQAVNIEGLACTDYYLWFVGSHSLQRNKPRPHRTDAENIAQLAVIKQDANRYLLGRIPLVNGELFGHCPHPENPDEELTAARLQLTSRGDLLMDALAEDPHLCYFVDATIPGKENGFEIEGIVIYQNRVFLGLRGPVLDRWAIILEIELEEDSRYILKLKQIGELGHLYKKHFVYLNGLGIRDLCLDGEDLLILARPTMNLDGPIRVYRLNNGANLQENKLSQPVLVLDIPCRNSEVMALFTDFAQTASLLIFHNSPAQARQKEDTSLIADVRKL